LLLIYASFFAKISKLIRQKNVLIRLKTQYHAVNEQKTDHDRNSKIKTESLAGGDKRRVLKEHPNKNDVQCEPATGAKYSTVKN